jgi:hypothetical protein
MKLIKTNSVVEVEDYPYGFRLRTTLFDSMEFNSKKGYRHVTQTVNPKNGLLNKPKKSTYSDVMFRYKDENGHIKKVVFNAISGANKDTNKLVQFLDEHFDLFTAEEREYFYQLVLTTLKVSMRGSVAYAGAKFEDLKPIFEPFVDAMVLGIKTPNENHFKGQSLDIEKIEGAKDLNYSPFKTATYGN